MSVDQVEPLETEWTQLLGAERMAQLRHLLEALTEVLEESSSV